MRDFKYYPKDFGKLPVKALHMDLVFDIYDDHTFVTSDFTLKNLKRPLKELKLDAKNLDIHAVYLSVGANQQSRQPLRYRYEKDSDKLILIFDKPILTDKKFTIRTETTCRPTKNILEGLYYDWTPAGAPPTQITQCQQWGFQRLVPCLDDMTAKCTYTTIILADRQYTNLISNGDPAPECVDSQGNPKPITLGNGRSKMVYYNHKTPMAPYLFFLGVGTYTTFTKNCVYLDGTSFRLELLVPPGSDPDVTEESLEITRQAIFWIHERTGYQYTGKVYREIGMHNSDSGGMENVGNTTIIANALLPCSQIDDNAYEYMIRVKVHEFYHNLNGSEVTGRSPFELWLNEAVTVHVEFQYWSHLLGKDYVRLQNLLQLYVPVVGALDQDQGPIVLPIIPKGFNDPHELITNVTYVKAPEFIRMIETLIGKKAFQQGLRYYYKKYKHRNATTRDWIREMEKASGYSLQKMAEGWLKRPGYPTVHAKTNYKKGKYTLELQQKDHKGQPWQFPIELALVGVNGKDIPKTSHIFWMKKQKEKIIYPLKEEPAYASLNRGQSYYGKLARNATPQQLCQQARNDPDIINRYFAYQELVEREKIQLIQNPKHTVDPAFLALTGEILQDKCLDPGVKGLLIRILEMVYDPTYNHLYQEIYDATQTIKRTLAQRYKSELLTLYHHLNTLQPSGDIFEQKITQIKHRKLKTTCLDLLRSLETPDVYVLLKKQLENPEYPDKYVALSLYLKSKASDKIQVAEHLKPSMAQHPVSWESYLITVSGTEGKAAIPLIDRLSHDSRFHIEQAPEQRALFIRYSANQKLSLLTPEGLEYLTQILLRVGKVNERTIFRILNTFNQLDRLETKHQVPIVKALLRVLNAFPEKEYPSIHNSIKRLLKGSPNALKAYEKKAGEKLRF